MTKGVFFRVGWCILVLLLLGNGVQLKAVGNVIEVLSNDVTTAGGLPIGATTEDSVRRTTTDDVPMLDRDHVTLALPDELFASTANLTLRLRDVIGQLILRSTARLAKFIRFIQPLFGGSLVIEIPKDME